jgi:hypothetical protein
MMGVDAAKNAATGGNMKLNSKRWNQGDIRQLPFAPQRKQAAHQVRIDGSLAHLFKQACRTDLPGWLPLGSVRLSGPEEQSLWSESETSSIVFQQPGLKTFWMTTLLIPECHRYQAVLINPEIAMGTLDVEMEEQGDGTLVRFDLSYTVLNEAGSALFDEGFGERLRELLERFGNTLKNRLTAEPAPSVKLASHPVRRQGVEHEIILKGDIDECFALACPVAELLWIDGWHFDLIYSESGKNETGCVFLEPSSGLSMLRVPGANTYWYVTRYDTDEYRFDAVWLTRDLTIARWEVSMTDLGGGQTRIHWHLTLTGLGEEGNQIMAEPGLDRRVKRGLSFIATSIKHYVETGAIYRLSGQLKVKIVASLIGASLGRHFRGLRAGEGKGLPASPSLGTGYSDGR